MSSQVFETKKINWRDLSSESLEDVYIILQNDNGPCPLIALVNTLILREPEAPNSSTPSLRSFTNGKPQVSVNALLEIMGDILFLSKSENDNHQDLDHVLSYLPSLVTGLNIDIRFNGSFVDSPEMALFRMYGIDPIHGWVCDPDSPQWNILQTVGSYDESQSILLKAEQMQSQQSKDEKEEQQVEGEQSKLQQDHHEDKSQLQLTAYTIKSFLSDYPSQLTPYGLTFLKDLLANNSLNILFRNDHFSTSFMTNNKLYTLVTDSGYKNESKVVWQSLSSVSGNNDNFYDATFNKVEIAEDENPLHNLLPEHDEDFLLARRLQEEADSALAQQLANERPSRGAPTTDTPSQQNPSTSRQQQQQPRQSTPPTAQKPSKKSQKKKDCIIM